MEKDDAILKTVRRIEDHIAAMDRDMEKDRQDLQNLSIEVRQLVGQVEQLRRATNMNAERTRDKVAEAVEPILDTADKLTTQIQKKKMVVLKEKGKSFWDKLLGR